MKKVLGIVLSIILSIILLGSLIYVAGFKTVLIAVGLSILIVAAIILCAYLLSAES